MISYPHVLAVLMFFICDCLQQVHCNCESEGVISCIVFHIVSCSEEKNELPGFPFLVSGAPTDASRLLYFMVQRYSGFIFCP